MTPEALSERLWKFAARVGKVVDALPDILYGDSRGLDEDEDDIGGGGPGFRDFWWAAQWGMLRKSELRIEGDLLDEFRSDNDVKELEESVEGDDIFDRYDPMVPTKDQMLSCDNRSVTYGGGGSTAGTSIQLQDTIYAVGNTNVAWTIVCTKTLAAKSVAMDPKFRLHRQRHVQLRTKL